MKLNTFLFGELTFNSNVAQINYYRNDMIRFKRNSDKKNKSLFCSDRMLS